MANIGSNASMSPVVTETVVGIITFVVSVSVSAFVGGSRWGRLEKDVENIKDDVKEIKGMFKMTLKE